MKSSSRCNIPGLALLLACLLGCAQPPLAHAQKADKADKVETVASLTMPAGADYARLRLLKEQGRMAQVYVDVLKLGDSTQANTLNFPPEMGKVLDVTPAGLTRLFTDTILKSRRFEVYDMSSTVTADKTDVVIDARIIGITQTFKEMEGGMQGAYTSVLVSVQMKDVYTGKYLFGTGVQVEGKTGVVTGDRTVLSPREKPDDPAVRLKLAGDYQLALRRAFILAGQKIESILRPQAAVLSVEGVDIGLVGGQQQGFQADDELIVFRPKIVKLGERELFAGTKAIALIRCDGAGTETSQCKLRSKLADFQPQEGDFAIITDASLRKTRWE